MATFQLLKVFEYVDLSPEAKDILQEISFERQCGPNGSYTHWDNDVDNELTKWFLDNGAIKDEKVLIHLDW